MLCWRAECWMEALQMGEIDTGPGLEAQISWDYSHSHAMPSVRAEQEALIAERKKHLKTGQSVEREDGNSVKVDTKGVSMNGGSESPTEGQQSNKESQGLEQEEGPTPLASAFQAASTDAWTEAEQQEEVLSQERQVPERAETAEEKDFRVKAEKRQKRTERAAQISSLAILSLLLIASCLFLVLAYTGWNVIAAAVALFCASVAGYPSLQLLWYALSSQMFGCWREMDPLERFKWGQKGASLVHSAIMALVGISILISGDWSNADLVKGRDDRVAAFLGLEIGYLIQDTGMEVYKQIAFGRSFSLLAWVHHLVILAALPWYYRKFKGDFFFGAFFLWNTSTVPLQLRWFQTTAGMQRGPLFQLNNLALLLSFLPCRIFIIPYLGHIYGSMKGWSLLEVLLRIPPTWTAAGAGLMAINMIWLYKLLRHGFSRPPRRRKKEGKQS